MPMLHIYRSMFHYTRSTAAGGINRNRGQVVLMGNQVYARSADEKAATYSSSEACSCAGVGLKACRYRYQT